MPAYEIAVILRTMSKGEMALTLRRTAASIMQRGGMIRKIENLGTRQLPYRMSAHGHVHRHGSYFLMHFESPPTAVDPIMDDVKRDVDVVRPHMCSSPVQSPAPFPPCTLEEELQPAAYRPSVQDLVQQGRKQAKRGWRPNTGLDYYPFQM